MLKTLQSFQHPYIYLPVMGRPYASQKLPDRRPNLMMKKVNENMKLISTLSPI